MNNDFKDIFDTKDLKNSPFKTPDGYFDSLESRILANAGIAPKEEKRSSKVARIFALRPVRWAAACICVLAVTATAYFFTIESKDDMMAHSTDMEMELNSNDAFNEAAEYAMLDSHDIYLMLAEE